MTTNKNKIALTAGFVVFCLIFQPVAFGSSITDSELNKSFTIHVGETVEIKSELLTITLLDISDSRCPKDVTCVWEGEVTLTLNVKKVGDKSKESILEIKTSQSSEMSFENYSIEASKIEPYPISTEEIKKEDYIATIVVKKKIVLPPLKQFKSGIPIEEIQCNENLVLLQKYDGLPVCVRLETKQKLIERGWSINQESDESTITISEGQREGPLLVQKILLDSIEGLNFPEYPIATNVGYQITLHIGDKASNGCTVELTLIKISNNTATFLKKEHQNRPCPICLSENTEINTPNGPINIKELKNGMTIFTQDNSGNKQTAIILKTGKTLVSADHKMVHVILDDKRELYASPSHPTSDGRLFGKLLAGNNLDGSKITMAELVPYNGGYTYDILPSGETGNYWANGILVKSTLQ